MSNDVILADDVAEQICKALGIEMDCIERIMLDFAAGEPVRVRVHMFGGPRLSGIDWNPVLEDAEVITTTLGEQPYYEDRNEVKTLTPERGNDDNRCC